MAFRQWTKSNSSYKNYAIDVSVSNCGESESTGSYTFGIAWGDIIISNINSTNNKCSQYSSYSSVLDGSSGTCNFSTFRGNIQTETYSLEFWINDSPLRVRPGGSCKLQNLEP